MRKGHPSGLLYAPSGELFAIATGADFVSEHEFGAESLVGAMTGQATPTASLCAQTLPVGAQMPDINQALRVMPDLEDLVFKQGTEHGVAVAAIGFTARAQELHLLRHPELGFSQVGAAPSAVGAWDEASFGFKVRGAELVQKLLGFYVAMQQGHVMLATHLTEHAPDFEHMRGVVLCDTRYLSDEHREAMKKAQASFEDGVMLLQHSRGKELLNQAHACFAGTGHRFGRALPAWGTDAQGLRTLVYRYEPGQTLDASLRGTYSFDELSQWLSNGAKGAIRQPVQEV